MELIKNKNATFIKWPPKYKPSYITRKAHNLAKDVFDWVKMELAKYGIEWKNCGLIIINSYAPEKINFNQAENIPGDEKLCDKEDNFLFFFIENKIQFSYFKFLIPLNEFNISLRAEVEPCPKTLRLKIFKNKKNITNQHLECGEENFYWLEKIENITPIINLLKRSANETRAKKSACLK